MAARLEPRSHNPKEPRHSFNILLLQTTSDGKRDVASGLWLRDFNPFIFYNYSVDRGVFGVEATLRTECW